MFDRVTQAENGDAAPAADVSRWSADPGLAPVFATRDGIVLVLDAAGERIIHASDRGAALQTAITDAAGRIVGARLVEQIRSAIPTARSARLVKIRFDTRGIARPTTCLIALATSGTDETVLLLAPTERLPVLRPPAVLPWHDPSPEPVSERVADPMPVPSGRFTWRSDAAGILTQLTGIGTSLTGRSWEALAESGAISSRSLGATLEAQRTFRAVPLRLRLPGSDSEIVIELSGMPSARPAQAFAGFSGFGVVRGVLPPARPTVADTTEPEAEESAIVPLEPTPTRLVADLVPLTEAADRDDGEASFAPAQEALDLQTVPDEAPKSTPDASFPPVDRAASTDDLAHSAEPFPDAASAPLRTTDLSTNEHAAFREIARALGARFAGDDTPAPIETVPDPERRGEVMAFPGSAARSASAAIDAAIVSALDRLPAGVLVHRDAEILYVNRRFLELADYSDRAALQGADVLAHLLGRLGSQDHGTVPDAPVSLATGGGNLLAVVVERSKVDWDGGPAELFLVRAAAQADQTREQIALGLLQERGMTQERDAQEVLEQIDEGVATLDDGGRILTLNTRAKAMLASDVREIVGGALADLFVPDSEPVIATSLREAGERGASGGCEVMPRACDGPLWMRIVKLSEANRARFCVCLRRLGASAAAPPLPVEPENGSRAEFLARVRHEIRTPLTGILAQAEALLSERLGPLGSERHRESLREIYSSGEHALGVLDDLVDIARIEAGRGALTFTDIALNDVVSGCIALMQPQAARDRIVVRTSLSPDLQPLVADERSMRQATLNVIANAIRLTEAGGQVIVSTTTAERGEIAFRVRDTGIGMTPEEIERALAPFSQSEVAGGRNGTGLGLTLTKALVEANRGRFLITSRKNEGTLVEMLFPPPQALSA